MDTQKDADGSITLSVAGESVNVPYRENNNGVWEVIKPGKRSWSPFANSDAEEKDVKQLLRKEFDDRY